MRESNRRPGQPGNDLVAWANRTEARRAPRRAGPGAFLNFRRPTTLESNRRPFSAEELAAIERFTRW